MRGLNKWLLSNITKTLNILTTSTLIPAQTGRVPAHITNIRCIFFLAQLVELSDRNRILIKRGYKDNAIWEGNKHQGRKKAKYTKTNIKILSRKFFCRFSLFFITTSLPVIKTHIILILSSRSIHEMPICQKPTC